MIPLRTSLNKSKKRQAIASAACEALGSSGLRYIVWGRPKEWGRPTGVLSLTRTLNHATMVPQDRVH